MKKIFKKNQLMITALALMIAVAGYLHFSGDVSDQITVTEGEEAEETSAEAKEAAHMIEYTVEDTYTADELAEMDVNSDMSATDADEAALDISDEDSEELVDLESLDSEVEYADTEGYEDELAAVDAQALAESSDVEEGEVPGEAVFTSSYTVNTLQGAKLMKEQTRAENKAALMEIINNTNLADEQKQAALDNVVTITQTAEKEMSAEILLDARGFEDAVVSITGDTVDVVVSSAELSDAQRAQIEDIVMRKTGVSIENIVISTTLE